MRSLWKPFYFSKVHVRYGFPRNRKIDSSFLNKRISVYSGNKMVSLLVKESMLEKFPSFFIRSKISPKHRFKKNLWVILLILLLIDFFDLRGGPI